MNYSFTEKELRGMASRLAQIVTDKNGCLERARRCLDNGELDGARLEMAKAIRQQIKFVKKYDTTGRLSSQLQELVHTREKLLKGTTWAACRKTFSRGWEIFEKAKSDLDVKVVGFLGGAVGFAAWIGRFVYEGDTHALKNIQGGARWARRLYRPVKAAIKTLVDPKGRRHFCDMCKSACEVAREKAERVWETAKNIGSRTVETAKHVAATGYKLARTATSSVADTARKIAHSVADATKTTLSTIGQVTTSAARTIGSSVRSGWATIKSWFS